MKYCFYCQSPVIIFMLDCPNCGMAYSPEKVPVKFYDRLVQFDPELLQDLHECGLNSSWIFRSYAISCYCIERQEKRMSREDFKNALTAIKTLGYI